MILGEIQNKILEFKDFFLEKKRYAQDRGTYRHGIETLTDTELNHLQARN